jgi:hypothetical protein
MIAKDTVRQTTSLVFAALFNNLLFAQTAIMQKPVSNESLDQYLWSFSKSKAIASDKMLVDFDAIDNWRGLGYYLAVSDDGEYFAYTVNRPTGTRYWFRRQDSLIIQGTGNNWRQAFATSALGFFSGDGKKYIFQNDSALCFLQLGTKEAKLVKNVGAFKHNAKNDWVAFRFKGTDGLMLHSLATGSEKRLDSIRDFEFEINGDWLVCRKDRNELLLYDLASGKERRFADVANYAFSIDGQSLLIKTQVNLQYITLSEKESTIIYTKEKTGIGNCSLSASGDQVVFTILDTADATNNAIGYYKRGMEKFVKINDRTEGMPGGLVIADVAFTDKADYIKIQLQAKPETREKPRDDNIAGLEVWDHKDTYVQSVQAKKIEHPLVYHAILSTVKNKVVFLESEDKKIFLLHGEYALVNKDYKEKYGDRFWEKQKDSCWLISLQDSSSRLIPAKKHQVWFSPAGNYLVYFDENKACHYFSYNLLNGNVKDISVNVSLNQLAITDREVEGKRSKFGNLAAWMENDAGVLVYDDYDIWKLDLTGNQPAVNISNGFGQSNSIALSLFATDRYSTTIPVVKANEPLVWRGFNVSSKISSFYKKSGVKVSTPIELSKGEYFLNQIAGSHDGNVSNVTGVQPLKAGNSDVWIVQRQSSNDAANYYKTFDFKNFEKLTFFEPHQNYQWFTEELLSFKHLDGKAGQGILYKPEIFDSTKKYPVLIVFYGAFSNNMHQFPVPTYIGEAMETGKSPLWFLNNGYLVFTPDIVVAPLKFGPKAFSVIEGAAQYLKSLPYVDANKLGCATHSWSAKLGAYLFTHSTTFSATAISEGFGYANMINMAFSGKEGVDALIAAERDFEYGELWKNKEVWFDQTTILNVDKAKSPLLLLCNKESSAEYQDQTLQFFTALRRLEKNVWWLKYDNGEHVLRNQKDLKDYTIRYTQFFDHYLKNAPAPQWMTQGIPYKLKGIERRYELDPQGTCKAPNGEPCLICHAWNAQYKKTPGMFQNEIKKWMLDSNIAEELERKQNEKQKELHKEGKVRIHKVLRMLAK